MKVIEVTMKHIDLGVRFRDKTPYNAMLTAIGEATGENVALDMTSNDVRIGNKIYGMTSTLMSWLHACKTKNGSVMPIKLLLTDGEMPVIALGLYNPDEEPIVEWYKRKNKEDIDVGQSIDDQNDWQG